MGETGGAKQGSLASYERKYGSLELMLSYARGRLRMFWLRQLLMFLAFAALGLVLPPVNALVAFLLTVLGDAADCLVLRNADRLLHRGMSEQRLRRLTLVTAFLHAAMLCAASSVPFWSEMPSLLPHTRDEPLFTIGLLVGAAINAGIVLPYHRSAVIAKLLAYAALPVAFLVVEITEVPVLAPLYHLHLAGLIVLYTSFFWFLSFVLRNFERTRGNMLAQALQQQELEGAYARLAEQQQQARQLALVAENANDSVILMNKAGRITWVNESFTRITGYSFDEALGHLPGDLLNSGETDPETVQQLQDSVRLAQPIRAEVRNRRKDGVLIWIETSQVPMLNSKGELETLIAVERDITAAKEHAQELEEARKAAEDGARAKADFLATMSHEIRTPMNGVIGMAELLQDSGLNEEQGTYASTILSSADTLLALINDVLDFSKMEAEELTLSPVNFDPYLCVRETVSLLQSQAAAKGLKLELDIKPRVPRELRGDDRRIRQILMNLIGNAVKFTERGHVHVSMDAQPEAEGYRLLLSVTDTGVGIPKEKLLTIFDRFSQADAAISRRFGGTGLGLAITRHLAEAMGGQVSVSSKPGQGSCFTVKLRLSPPEEETAQEPLSLPQPGGQPALDGLKVLVADDNQVNRMLVEKFLKSANAELTFAGDGQEAVSQFERFSPDVILMDMSMPVMDGLEATRAIRSMNTPQPVIVALTANAFDSDREACLAAGMDAFMCKPVNKQKLLEMLAGYAAVSGGRCTG